MRAGAGGRGAAFTSHSLSLTVRSWFSKSSIRGCSSSRTAASATATFWATAASLTFRGDGSRSAPCVSRALLAGRGPRLFAPKEGRAAPPGFFVPKASSRFLGAPPSFLPGVGRSPAAGSLRARPPATRLVGLAASAAAGTRAVEDGRLVGMPDGFGRCIAGGDALVDPTRNYGAIMVDGRLLQSILQYGPTVWYLCRRVEVLGGGVPLYRCRRWPAAGERVL